jgi:predicted transposase YbfD/YdcC
MIRGAKSHGKKSPIHMVSAWACENNPVLGQVKTAEKSNEITAIPELLNILNIAGNTITIDATGTQKEIAENIIDKNADYIFAVKANQPQLLEHIKDKFRLSKQHETYTKQDLNHGCIETRTCSLITDFKLIEQNSQWKNLTSIIKIDSIREFKNSDKAIEKVIRYYISSLRNDASEFQSKIRSYWAVENKLHWTLEVAFSEDASRKRAENAAQNYSILLKIALNLLKNENSKKLSIKSKRLEDGWNKGYLLRILNLKV